MSEQNQGWLPRFGTREEEAAFWDTHSLSDFKDELVAVKRPRVRRPLEHHLSVRLEASVLTELAAAAAELGVGPSTLARMWIMQRLAQERAERTPATSAPPADKG